MCLLILKTTKYLVYGWLKQKGNNKSNAENEVAHWGLQYRRENVKNHKYKKTAVNALCTKMGLNAQSTF